jgi:plasmid stability protein
VLLWYCASVEMKNITVRVPEDVYRSARVRAAEQGSSVSALVSQFLRTLADSDAEFVRLEQRQQEIQSGIRQFKAGDRLDRDALHDRALR